ncbi:hypothetical protein [Cryobacterium tepidiphilum]|jgi:hypothetical protein|uniref:Uncharacterized protein n=1 Tax=Cryobacterium tepidiphilum TaxID=2486026 RepID=A0A3M8LN58_9MICO|nr:hypothetical protein [Cryobacterium tepidiphilum]RNE66910.1 hypothetical protein EEJ31_01490 [Cryobacterium tepidiphilum]
MAEGTSARKPPLLRAILPFVLVGVLLVVALFSAIGALNQNVYSAAGFVRQYLDAIARHDAAGALAIDGVLDGAPTMTGGKDYPHTLLRSSVLGSLTGIALADETVTGDGTHTVTYNFRLDGKESTMTFTVEDAGRYAAVFNRWRFAVSPLAVLQVSVLHGSTFTVNGLTLDTRAHEPAERAEEFSHQASYLVFAPTAYAVSHTSPLLQASPNKVPVVVPGTTAVTVDVQPNKSFVQQVQNELNGFLDDCAKQTVLKPTNCPFGIDIDDRVLNDPKWSIAKYPPVTLRAGDGTFDMPDTEGLARIVVDVQSLFDGEVSTRDENVEFAVGLSVIINTDGSLRIQLH